MHQPQPSPTPAARLYTNTALTALVALLGYIALNVASHAGPSAAYAQGSMDDPEVGGLISAAEQRKIMISELRNISMRLERIESDIAGGVSVRVKEMPPMQAPVEREGRTERRGDSKPVEAKPSEGRPEPRVEIKPSAKSEPRPN